MFNSQLLLVRFGMPGMPIVKPVGFSMPGMPGMTDFDVYHDICILKKVAKFFSGELEVTGFMPGNKCRF